MQHLAAYNLILYNFFNSHLNNLLILHCWPIENLHSFDKLQSHNYVQYLHVDAISEFQNFNRDYLEHKLTKLGVYLDTNCKNAEHVLGAASNDYLYSERYHWLLSDQYARWSEMEETFAYAPLSINADLTYFMPVLPFNASHTVASRELINFRTYDIYSRGSELEGTLNITVDEEVACNASSCRLVGYLSELHTRSKFQQRQSLSGISLRLSTLVTVLPLTSPIKEIFDFLNSDSMLHLDIFARLGFRLKMILKDMLQCNYTYILNDRWVVNQLTGGSLGEMLNGTADITNTPFGISELRLKYFKPLSEVSPFSAICLFRTSRVPEVRADAFLAPFTPNIWIIYGSLLLVAGLLLWYTFRLEQRSMWQCYKFLPSLTSTCLISLGSACIQGSYLIPRSIGGRMTFYVLMLTSFIIYNYYTSIVVSSLLGTPPSSNIKTLEQLADSTLDVALDTAQYIRQFAETSPMPLIREFYRKKLASKKDTNSASMSTEQGVLKVRDTPGFVFITDTANAFRYVRQHFLPHQICELNEISFRPEKNIYNIVNKNLTYKELIKMSELRMTETGVLRKHRDYWIRMKLHCYNNNHVVNVGIEYVAPLFIMLLGAYVCALLVLVLEILSKQFVDRQPQQRL